MIKEKKEKKLNVSEYDLLFSKTKSLFAGISKLITTVQSIDEVLQKIMEEVELFFNPTNWSLIRLDDSSNELFFEIAKGLDPEKIKDIRLKIGEGIAGKVVETKETILIEDVSKSKDFSQRVDKASGFVTKSIVAVPILFGDRVFGVIQLINKADGTNFTQQELFVLETIGKFSGIAFVNAMYYEELVNIAQRDALTGLFNRVKLEKVTEAWKCDSKNYASAILIDLNDFKTVNDTEGHKAGDHLLRNLSQILTSSLNPGDLLFRLGGDEFLILVESMDNNCQKNEKDYEAKMEKALTSFDHKAGFSYGISSGLRSKINDIIAESDKNMYTHKTKMKKNRS